MARRKNWHGFSPRSAVATGRAGTLRARPAPRRRRTYQFERLEDRLTMAGENVLAVDLAVRTDVLTWDVVDISPPVPAAQPIDSEELPEQFQSAAEFEAWLIEAAVAQWGNLFGQTTYNPNGYWGLGYHTIDTTLLLDGRPIILRANFALDAAVPGNAAMAFDATKSSTNIQVEGVDEADLVETDGEYLYILSGNELVIVEAGIGDELRIASRIQLAERPVGMYLAGNRLALVSTSYGAAGYDRSLGDMVLFDTDYGYYGSYGRATTTVTVLDVADRSAPTLVHKSQMDGQLVTSRVVDGELRLVLNNSINLPRPIARPVEGEATIAPAPENGQLRFLPVDGIPFADFLVMGNYWNPISETQYVYETQDEYVARIKAEIFKSAMPGLRILDAEGNVLDEQLLTEPTSIYRPESPHDRNITTIATFDLSSNAAGPAATASVFTSNPAQVYATADSVYLFSDTQDWDDWSTNSGPTTTIRKFDIDSQTHGIEFSARGKVEGTLLNQFAADEHDGYLRVVTSSSWNGGHNVFVLEQVGTRLKVVGSVEGIAPGERLHSVRFMGDRVFFVTFRQIDPFFAVDLSDPAHPTLMGELKIPGVSGYLQPIDENTVLGVGRNADPANGLFNELIISLFDVSDLTDPKLLHQYAFDGQWTTSTPILGPWWVPTTGEHHAASYFPDEQIFAMPINSMEGGWLHGIDATPIFEPGEGGLQVFRIDVETGFTPIGLIEHDTLIERSVRIGEHLFAISSGTVSVHELADPTIELGSLDIGQEGVSPLVELRLFQPVEMMLALDTPAEQPPAIADLELLPSVATSTERTSSPLHRLRAMRDAFSAVDELLLVSHIAGHVVSEPSSGATEPFDAALAATDDQGTPWSLDNGRLRADLASPLATVFFEL